MNWKKNLLFVGLIALAMITRFLPHAPNFTAVGAVAIFGGFIFSSNWKAFLVPLLALFISDLLINNFLYTGLYEGFVFFTEGFYYIYAALLLSAVLGRYATSGFKPLPLLGAGIGSALLFYLITNFGVWMQSPMYTKDLSGLMTSYTLALPFLLNQVMGTLLYGGILFGAAYYILHAKSAKTVNA